MKFETFLEKYKDSAVIDSSSFAMLDEKLSDIRRQVSGWEKKGYLLQLKKGVYFLNNTFRKSPPAHRFIANYLVSPSYLSVEYALGYYDLIPEGVTVYSSVTTKKTQSFSNILGKFDYQSVKESLFFGFIKADGVDHDFFVALPEKAVLDFFYLREDIKGSPGEFEAFRFQNLEIIKLKRFYEFSQAYPRRVKKAAREFIEFVRQERRAYTTIK